MSDHASVLVTLDGTVHDPDRPLLHADDLAAVRGDGIFETLLVRNGRACLVESHLRRLTQSSTIVELPKPDLDAWRRAIGAAVAQWATLTNSEGALRLVYSRGREIGSDPTAYLTIGPLAPRVAAARTNGISAVLLDHCLPATGTDAMPWLLAGAKTLSYATNMAALRHAATRGADDVIFVSSDGYLLEGPRSTVVIATAGSGGRLCLLTPPPWYPILRGTTQQALFEVARKAGHECDYQTLRPADLLAAQGVWLLSSITLGAWVHTLDGKPLAPTDARAEMAALVEDAILSDR